jgi:hypothetical protein
MDVGRCGAADLLNDSLTFCPPLSWEERIGLWACRKQSDPARRLLILLPGSRSIMGLLDLLLCLLAREIQDVNIFSLPEAIFALCVRVCPIFQLLNRMNYFPEVLYVHEEYNLLRCCAVWLL